MLASPDVFIPQPTAVLRLTDQEIAHAQVVFFGASFPTPPSCFFFFMVRSIQAIPYIYIYSTILSSFLLSHFLVEVTFGGNRRGAKKGSHLMII